MRSDSFSFLAFAAFFLIGVYPCHSQKLVILNPCPYVYVDVPNGYRVVDRTGYTDAWFAKLTSQNDTPVIAVSCGLVESLTEKNNGKLTDIYTDENSGEPILFAAVKTSDGQTLFAKVFWAQFAADVQNEEEANLFRFVVKSFRKAVIKEKKQ